MAVLINNASPTTDQQTAFRNAFGLNSALAAVNQTTMDNLGRTMKSWRNEHLFAIQTNNPIEPGLPKMQCTASFSGTTMTVTAVVSGHFLSIGQVLKREGLTGETKITALGTGTGGTGTYTVNTTQTIGSGTVTSDWAGQTGGAAITTGIAVPTGVCSLRGFKVLQRTNRIHLEMITGIPGTVYDPFQIQGYIEVPVRVAGVVTGRKNIPLRWGGSKSYTVPTDAGSIIKFDTVCWPVETSDVCHVKIFASKGGTSFNAFSTGVTKNTVLRNIHGISDMCLLSSTDQTGILYGSAPWTEAANNASTPFINFTHVFTTSAESGRQAGVDIWGDDNAAGAGCTSVCPWLEQLLFWMNMPFNNYAISAETQGQIPQYAEARMQQARGDIAIINFGRLSTSTTEYDGLVRYLRGMGYRKIYAVYPFDVVNTDNTVLVTNFAAFRTYIDGLVTAGTIDGVMDPRSGIASLTTGIFTTPVTQLVADATARSVLMDPAHNTIFANQQSSYATQSLLLGVYS